MRPLRLSAVVRADSMLPRLLARVDARGGAKRRRRRHLLHYCPAAAPGCCDHPAWFRASVGTAWAVEEAVRDRGGSCPLSKAVCLRASQLL